MSLQKVIFLTDQGESLEIPLRNPQNGLYIDDITGLGPVKAEITSSTFGNVDGEQYQASRRGKRNIVVKLGFAPDYLTTTVYSLRQYLYSLFMPKSQINLRFFLSEGLVLYITGIIEDFDAPIFTQEPTATLSILCFDPDFSTSKRIVGGNTLHPLSSNNESSCEINYDGSSPTGFLYQQIFSSDVPVNLSLTVSNNVAGTSSINIENYEFEETDELQISTIPGSKGVWVVRDSVRESILYNVEVDSVYSALYYGINTFRVVTNLEEYYAIPFVVTYLTKYGGL